MAFSSTENFGYRKTMRIQKDPTMSTTMVKKDLTRSF